MDKKLTIGIVIVLLLLLVGGAGYFFLNHRPQSPSSGQDQQVGSDSQVSEDNQPGAARSLRSLLSFVGSQKCEFTDNTTGSTGTVYVSTGRIRGDFSTPVEGKPSVSHMYSDGQTMYIWMDNSTTGYKSSLSAVETGAPEPTGEAGKVNFDIDQQVDYNCGPWAADESMFSLPADVQFTDFSQLMQQNLQVTGIPDASSKCDACNALSGEAKSQCLTALGCE